MTWRQKLLHTNIYDLLCRMQDNMEKVREQGETPCILNALSGKKEFDRHCGFRGHCPSCIAAWLNEEVKS